MKIAVNCSYFQPYACGIKEYIHNLIENLSILDKDNEYVLYVLADNYSFAQSLLHTRFRIKTIPFRGDTLFDVVKRSLLSGNFWRREEQIEKWDIFHSPFFYAPRLKNARLLLTVHDVRLYRHHDTYTRLRYQYLRRVVERSVKRADRIIAVSQFTKDELCEAYGISGEKVTVIHEALNPRHFLCTQPETAADSLPLPGDAPYILTVGTLEPRKNHMRLIEAFHKALPSLPPGTKLVIAGKKGHGYKSLLAKIRESEDIIYLNFVPSGMLNRLYRGASLFVFPSIYEGFGFPPLEAGFHGVPSAVSNFSSMPEVCGDAVLYFNPLSVDDMAEKIVMAMTDEGLRAGLSSRMAGRLAARSWRENAQATLDLYRSML